MTSIGHPILLALLAALFIGVGDFVGGRATRRAGATITVAIAQAVAAALMIAILFAWKTPWPDGRDLAIALGVGLIDGIGLILLYHGLGHGRAGIVAPLAGVISVVIPAGLEVVFLRELSPVSAVGIAIAVLAIVGLSRSHGGDGDAAAPRAAIRLSWITGAAAGIIFGFVGFFLGILAPASAPASLALLRIVAALIAGLALLRVRERPALTAPSLGLIVIAGLLDGTAMLTYLLAASQGLIGVAAAVVSLNIGIVVLLAFVILGQRIDRWQQVGLALGATAIIVLAASHG